MRVRSLVLVATLAAVCKFIVFDPHETEPPTPSTLAAAILAPGVHHWLVRDQRRPAGCDGAGD